ncbi:MAG: ABC transporter permease [Chloroflexales bacterium]|nr:ABC transporter permease [Chloroflexales bacterium]
MSNAYTPRDYDSDALGVPALRELVELPYYGTLLRLLISTSLYARYKRSVLGIIWTLLNPLLYMLVLTAAFSALFRSQLPHYEVYVLVGLICWNFFAQTTVAAAEAIVGGGATARRIYFPRTLFALATLGASLVNFIIALGPLALIMLALGHPIFLAWAFLPVSLLLLALFTLGITLLVSTLATFFFDTLYLYQVIIQALFFLTPIIYPRETVPEAYQPLIALNPLTAMIELVRAPLYAGHPPDSATLLIAAVWAIAAATAGWLTFTANANRLAYRV